MLVCVSYYSHKWQNQGALAENWIIDAINSTFRRFNAEAGPSTHSDIQYSS